MRCSYYFDKILSNHGWQSPSKTETRLVEPLCLSALKELETTEGSFDHRPAKALEEEMDFRYRAILGDWLYAYVTCRLDIGYAVAKLS